MELQAYNIPWMGEDFIQCNILWSIITSAKSLNIYNSTLD